MKLDDSDFHPHLRARMQQRGVTKEEIERTLSDGWKADDSKPRTLGKVFVFPYRSDWGGKYFEEKEVRVYYKLVGSKLVLLSAKARYGRQFLKEAR